MDPVNGAQGRYYWSLSRPKQSLFRLQVPSVLFWLLFVLRILSLAHVVHLMRSLYLQSQEDVQFRAKLPHEYSLPDFSHSISSGIVSFRKQDFLFITITNSLPRFAHSALHFSQYKVLQKEQIVVRQGNQLQNVRHNTQTLTVISEAFTLVFLLLSYLHHEIAPEQVPPESVPQSTCITPYSIRYRKHISL